jgi:4-hydroxy-2-oxoheptanedioate aldolase
LQKVKEPRPQDVASELSESEKVYKMIFQNSMKKALREGKIVFGPMVSEIRTPGIAVLFAQAGFDFFFIDMEHSSFTFETVSDMVMAGRAAGIPAIVRPSTRGSHDALSRPLDIGAAGLLVPQIQTREDVENVVRWCMYQPVGEREMLWRDFLSSYPSQE